MQLVIFALLIIIAVLVIGYIDLGSKNKKLRNELTVSRGKAVNAKAALGKQNEYTRQLKDENVRLTAHVRTLESQVNKS